MANKIPLRQNIIYGPINSRRLGRSLGINLTPPGTKICSFDCVYCQYGETEIKSRLYDPSPVNLLNFFTVRNTHPAVFQVNLRLPLLFLNPELQGEFSCFSSF